MFLSSFYCYLKYDSKNDFVIDLDNVWKWLGFSQKNNAKMLLEKQFIIDKDYKRLLLSQQKQNNASEASGTKKDIRGGHNKEIFLLSVDTFKKFCLKAGTKKADEIHEYFIKLENIMLEITKEESDELKKQVLKLENKIKEAEEKIFKEKEKVLLKQFATSGSLVYIIKVKNNHDGSYIVKIGESRIGIQNRYSEHKTKYEECILLDCFEVDKSHEFEQFLHHHPVIFSSKVTNLLNHEKENELFLIGNELTYNQLLKIIDDTIGNYNYKVRELLLEIENLKLKNNGQTINNDNEIFKRTSYN